MCCFFSPLPSLPTLPLLFLILGASSSIRCNLIHFWLSPLAQVLLLVPVPLDSPEDRGTFALLWKKLRAPAPAILFIWLPF